MNEEKFVGPKGIATITIAHAEGPWFQDVHVVTYGDNGKMKCFLDAEAARKFAEKMTGGKA